MAKISIKDFQVWCAEADEEQLLCAKAQLDKEVLLANTMRLIVTKRLEYLDRFNVRNIVGGKAPQKIINSLILPPEIQS